MKRSDGELPSLTLELRHDTLFSHAVHTPAGSGYLGWRHDLRAILPASCCLCCIAATAAYRAHACGTGPLFQYCNHGHCGHHSHRCDHDRLGGHEKHADNVDVDDPAGRRDDDDFFHLRAAPFRRLASCIPSEDWPLAARQLEQIRLGVMLNLAIGLSIIALMKLGRV